MCISLSYLFLPFFDLFCLFFGPQLKEVVWIGVKPQSIFPVVPVRRQQAQCRGSVAGPVRIT